MSRIEVTFLPEGRTVEVDTERPIERHDGKPGSILQIALEHGVDIDHACGGVCACSTCHVVVREGFEDLSEPCEDEEDLIDSAPGHTLTSRLACQAVPQGHRDVVVEVPNWNRNFVKESHG